MVRSLELVECPPEAGVEVVAEVVVAVDGCYFKCFLLYEVLVIGRRGLRDRVVGPGSLIVLGSPV